MTTTFENSQISVVVNININQHPKPPEQIDQGKLRLKDVLEWVGTIAAMVGSVGTILSNGGLF